MTFRERSAWIMGIIMLLTGGFFVTLAGAVPRDAPALAQLGVIVPFVGAVIIGSIVVQIALAILYRRDAGKPADEREQIAIARAGHWSGVVLAVGVLGGAGSYLYLQNGNLLLQSIIGALILAQIAEYAFQIILFRRGV